MTEEKESEQVNDDDQEKVLTIDEGSSSEKPKRPGRKKRQTSTVSTNDSLESESQPLFEQPVIVEGKRSRKPTSRLELAELSPPRKEFSIPLGHGKPLGEIPYIQHQLLQAPLEDLNHLRTVCFGRRGSKTNLRKNLQEFKGFEFNRQSDEYQRHLTQLVKLKKEQIRVICDLLGLDSSSDPNGDAEKILNFLLEPTDQGKPIITKKAEHVEDDDDEDEKVENGDEKDEDYVEDDEEIDEDENEGGESDDDYLGSDDDDGRGNNDDPDDFAYQPGKKAPKKKSSLKRAKRKRTKTTKNKRSPKKIKVAAAPKKPVEEIEEKKEEVAPADPPPMETETR